MGQLLKAVAVVGMGLSLTSFSIEPRFSATALSALDPARIAQGRAWRGVGAGFGVAARSSGRRTTSKALPIPLYADLTKSSFPVTTTHAQARRYFSQGLLLTYGFNHSGAVRSFREGQRLDPDCAICWWGEAVALGPNIHVRHIGERAGDSVDHFKTSEAYTSDTQARIAWI